jgi:PIN domain nuclease of toxin-antitoxin system
VRLLLDTHIWLWSLSDPAKLGRRVKSALTAAGNELWVSPISVWELLVLVERGRVKLDDEPRRWVAEAMNRTPAEEAALTFEVAIRSREVMSAHSDPVDRFLVATALVYDLTLVTADDVLIDAKLCPVLKAK